MVGRPSSPAGEGEDECGVSSNIVVAVEVDDTEKNNTLAATAVVEAAAAVAVVVVVDNIAAAVAAAVAAEVDDAMGCGGAETKMVEAMEVKVVEMVVAVDGHWSSL